MTLRALLALALLLWASAASAFPALESHNGGGDSAATTSRALNMPAGIVAGNILIALTCTQTTGGTVSDISGWTAILRDHSGGTVPRLDVFAKVAAGGDTATLTSNNAKTAHIVMRISGVHDDALTGVEISAAATGTSNTPDPPSLNPAGWDTEDTLWIPGYAQDRGLVGFTPTAPTSYAMIRHETATGDTSGTRCGVAAAERDLAAASEDPGAFANSNDDPWRAFTIAIRPAAAAPTGCGVILGGGMLRGCP